MKVCSKCGLEKAESDYYMRGSRPHSYCKPCFNAYCVNRWIQKIQKKRDAVAWKGGVCMDCGGQFHYAVYEFHHLDPTQKDVGWDRLRLRSPDRIKKELKGCVLLCANCHRLHHALSP